MKYGKLTFQIFAAMWFCSYGCVKLEQDKASGFFFVIASACFCFLIADAILAERKKKV